MSKWISAGQREQGWKWWGNESKSSLICFYSNLFFKVSFPTSSVYHFLPTHKTLVQRVRTVRTLECDDPAATRKVAWIWISLFHQSVISSRLPKRQSAPAIFSALPSIYSSRTTYYTEISNMHSPTFNILHCWETNRIVLSPIFFQKVLPSLRCRYLPISQKQPWLPSLAPILYFIH